jgi:hypothetical protein
MLHGSGFSRDKALRIPRCKPGPGSLPGFFLLRRHDVLPQRQSEDSKAPQKALNAPGIERGARRGALDHRKSRSS